MLTRRSLLGGASAICGLSKMGGLTALASPTGREYHVSANGDDKNDGTSSRPLRAVSAAAAKAYPGDVVTVHAGIYRERVTPPRGGESAARPIVYQAAQGEKVVLTGAEVLKGWKQEKGDVWTVTIPNSYFGSFNPYSDLIHGDWFDAKGRQHHTGAVYLNGDWLAEAAQQADVDAPQGAVALWFGRVDEKATTLWAQFKGVNPNTENVEINVRQTVFYPAQTGIDYITVRGLWLQQAATPWAPPTAEQIGVIGTHWSKGWVIENNQVSYSICSGISLGKYGDEHDNTSAEAAEGYVKTIERATARGWSKENIGHHTVRGNTVSHCEQAGIVGSLGPVFCTVTDNEVHHIHVRKLFTGFEQAGIKFHAAIDTDISNNYIHHCSRGLWLDWMAQGTVVSGNLMHDNSDDDGLVEVDHGPFLFANNLLLSKTSQVIVSRGAAFVHNLFCGKIFVSQYDGRMTPFMKAHSCEVAGLHDNPSGDVRFYNNIFAQDGDLSQYDVSRLPIHLEGNVFLHGAKPCAQEAKPLLKPEFNPAIEIVEKNGVAECSLKLDHGWATEETRLLVTTALLGEAVVPKLPFERADGSAIRIDKDYLGKARDVKNPFPGPLEISASGSFSIPARRVRR